MSETVLRTARAYYAATRALDIDGIVNLCDEKVVLRTPVSSPAATGKEAARKFFQTIRDLFDAIGVTEEFWIISLVYRKKVLPVYRIHFKHPNAVSHLHEEIISMVRVGTDISNFCRQSQNGNRSRFLPLGYFIKFADPV